MGLSYTFRMISIVLTFFVVACGVAWIRNQQQQIDNLLKEKNNLQIQAEQMSSVLQQIKLQATALERVIYDQQKKQQNIENENYEFRKKIRHSLVGDNCAGVPVPDDVIRMQQDAINP